MIFNLCHGTMYMRCHQCTEKRGVVKANIGNATLLFRSTGLWSLMGLSKPRSAGYVTSTHAGLRYIRTLC